MLDGICETSTFANLLSTSTVLLSFHVAKTKAMICAFVFAYANCWFSHDAARVIFVADIIFHAIRRRRSALTVDEV